MLTSVVINEFLAQNTSGLMDEDGDRSDWIELQNLESSAVDLGGWYLTDNEANLTKWQLPPTTIAAGEYLVVFASGKDRANPSQQLHTNFALAVDGESLLLVMPDGTTIADSFVPFPAQSPNISYGRAATELVSELLVDEEAPVRALIPTSNVLDGFWYDVEFDDSSWLAGTTGVGYEESTTGISYAPYINLDVGADMIDFSTSAYIRVPFDVANPSELASLKLQIRYDDGFVAYLNGMEIPSARRNAPAGTPSFNWNASGSHNDSLAVQYQEIDISEFRNLLQPGENVLAIHGLNQSLNSSDFLISPLLVAERAIASSIGYMTTPTPGAANAPGTLGFVEDTNFSVDRGFYSSPFTVAITSQTADAEIRYTLNGSAPTATTGFVYDPLNPPLISTTTILRAAAFKNGFTPTNVDTQTYIFLDDVIQQNGSGLAPHANWGHAGPDWALDPDVVNHPLYAGTIVDDLQALSTVSLVLPWETWFGTGGQGIYISGSNVERAGSVELFSADGSEEFQIDAALEIQGGSSTDRWKVDKLSVRATFKAPFGPTKLESELFVNPLFDMGATARFDTLIFDAVSNHSWHYGGNVHPQFQRDSATLIQDQLVADFQNLMGGQAPHGRFVHLYLNGLYWGVYYLHERPDESFAEAYLGGDKDDYDVLKHTPTTVVQGDATAVANYAVLLNAVRQNLTLPANYQAVEQLLDIDDFIDYMLVNYFVGNDDWDRHNWYATFNRVDPDGKWRFHSWDAEHIFESVNYNATSRFNSGAPTEVHQHLTTNPEYLLRFADRVQKHFFNGGVLTPASTAALLMARASEIDRAIVAESARWGDNQRAQPYTRADWLSRLNDLLVNYFPQRTQIVLNQFAARGWLATIPAPLFSHYGGSVDEGFELGLSMPVGSSPDATLYFTLDGSDPRLTGGEVSTAAFEYSTPIAINAGTQVKARILDRASRAWSPVVEATFLLEIPLALRITELHYHPAETEEHEFIELLNAGNQPISLDGVQVTDFASTPYTFPSGLTLLPGQRIVVARNPDTFQAEYGMQVFMAATGYAEANLSNGGETVSLRGPFGELLQSITYSDDPPWPTQADGLGPSLEIIDPLGNPNDPFNWRASARSGGSPGTSGNQLPGDYNDDGRVNAADFIVWRNSQHQQVVPYFGADGDGSGVVDSADYIIWRDNFGATLPAVGAAVVATLSSHEPTAEVFLVLVPTESHQALNGGRKRPTEPNSNMFSATIDPRRDLLLNVPHANRHVADIATERRSPWRTEGDSTQAVRDKAFELLAETRLDWRHFAIGMAMS